MQSKHTLSSSRYSSALWGGGGGCPGSIFRLPLECFLQWFGLRKISGYIYILPSLVAKDFAPEMLPLTVRSRSLQVSSITCGSPQEHPTGMAMCILGLTVPWMQRVCTWPGDTCLFHVMSTWKSSDVHEWSMLALSGVMNLHVSGCSPWRTCTVSNCSQTGCPGR